MREITEGEWLRAGRIKRFILELKEGGASSQEAIRKVAAEFCVTESVAKHLVWFYWRF